MARGERPDGTFGVLSTEEAEVCDYCVCMPWSNPPIAPDNRREKCCACERPIQVHRTSPRKPAKICFECMLDVVKAN